MTKTLRSLIASMGALPALALAAEPIPLSQEAYKAELGVLIIQVNWGRRWKCGRFENAQLEALAFTRSPIDESPVSLELEPPSKLFVDNKYLPYAFVVQPGDYALTGYDVKVARSSRDVGHFRGSKEELIKEGQPIGGQFTVKPGEIVYVGHFGLDCDAEPFLWRKFIPNRADFEDYVDGFRSRYTFVKDVPVQYRLFSTKVFGGGFSLANPTVN